MNRHFALAAAALPLTALTAAPALAAETIRYGYDTRGRLTDVVRRGGPAPAATRYTLDRADNRIGKTVQATPVLANASFETPEVGAGFQYQPAAAGTTFGPASGIAGNGSAWGFAPAPDGDQVAFVQSGGGNAGTMSLTASGLTAGIAYTLSFHTTQRPGFARNPISVRVDGVPIGTYDPPSTDFTRVTTPAFVAGGSSATIAFSGQMSAADAASAIDAVTIASSPP